MLEDRVAKNLLLKNHICFLRTITARLLLDFPYRLNKGQTKLTHISSEETEKLMRSSWLVFTYSNLALCRPFFPHSLPHSLPHHRRVGVRCMFVSSSYFRFRKSGYRETTLTSPTNHQVLNKDSKTYMIKSRQR